MDINLISIKSALVSTVLMAILTVATYIISIGNIFNINWYTMVNLGAMSLLAGLVSLIKQYLTNSDGKAVGIQVK